MSALPGRLYTFHDIKIEIGGKPFEGITSVSYARVIPRSTERISGSASGTFTIDTADFHRLIDALRPSRYFTRRMERRRARINRRLRARYGPRMRMDRAVKLGLVVLEAHE